MICATIFGLLHGFDIGVLMMLYHLSQSLTSHANYWNDLSHVTALGADLCVVRR